MLLKQVYPLILGIALGMLISFGGKTYRLCTRIQRSIESAHTTGSAATSQTSTLSHVVLIMDGNRRWAKERGMEPWEGHKAGIQPLKDAVRICLERNIPYLTVYAFSLENFKRPERELNYLFNTVARQAFEHDLRSLAETGVRVRCVGDRSKFPETIASLISDTEKRTAHGSRLTLTILFSYGGQQEITDTAQRLAQECLAGMRTPESITTDSFASALWTGTTPPPDLIIRTGGHKRLSNCLPFQSAYAELTFLDLYWPEVTKEVLMREFDAFEERTRNFGA